MPEYESIVRVEDWTDSEIHTCPRCGKGGRKRLIFNGFYRAVIECNQGHYTWIKEDGIYAN